MKLTLSWLKSFLRTDANATEIALRLTAIGLEIEEVIDPSKALGEFIVAQINETKPHPDASKLQICQVNNGKELLQIVCGAANARAGLFVVLAPIGVTIPANGMKIKPSKIRGIESQGMLCSAEELGLNAEGADGIIEVAATSHDIGKVYATFAGLNDPIFDIGLTPNRGDCLGVYGIARDLAASGLGELITPAISALKPGKTAPIKVEIGAKDVCTQFLGYAISGVRNTQSPDWLKHQLTAIGLKPISALVDISNYMMMSFGRPLHVYDAQKLAGGLMVRYATEGEKITALNHQTYTLTPSMLVVADNQSVQAIAGVMGAEASGCTFETTSVFVEIAHFDASSVANTGRALELVSDSRYRFERGIDKVAASFVLDMTASLILDICGGELSAPVTAIDVKTPVKKILFDEASIQSLSGVKVESARVKTILTALGLQYDGKEWLVPSWRSDIHGPADLVEEIIRIVGYDQIPLEPLPYMTQLLEEDILQKQVYRARMALVEMGMNEIISWSFMHSKKAAAFMQNQEPLLLVNPISSELDQMRPSIIPNLLDACAKNATRGAMDLALFEIGRVYHGTSANEQKLVAAGLHSGKAVIRHVHGQARDVDIFDAKQDVYAALQAMEIPVDNLTTELSTSHYYHPGRSGALKLGKEILAFFGEIHPRILKEWDVAGPIVIFEIYLEVVSSFKKRSTSARKPLQVSDYQMCLRDFAFVIAKDVPAERVMRAIQKTNKELIEAVNLFDVYEGQHVAEGQKSIAISVQLRAKDHTLSETELETVSAMIIEAVNKLGGTLR